MANETFEQPTMNCPKCGKEYEDFDGVGVVYCEPPAGCGFCAHVARTGHDIDGRTVMVCDFCHDMKNEEDDLRADLATKTRELAEMEHRAESAERDVERLRRKIDGIRPSVNRRAIEASLQCTEQRERAEKAEKALMEFGAVLGRVARENHAEALLRLVDERGDLIRRSDTAERELAEARAQLAESRAEGERLRAEAARWQSLAEQWSAGLIHQSNGLVEERDSLRTQLEQAQQRIAELTKPRNARVRRVPEKCPKDPKCVRGKRHRGGCMDWRDNVLLPEKVSP